MAKPRYTTATLPALLKPIYLAFPFLDKLPTPTNETLQGSNYILPPRTIYKILRLLPPVSQIINCRTDKYAFLLGLASDGNSI